MFKITQNVAFENFQFWRVFKTGLPDMSLLKGQKMVKNAKIATFEGFFKHFVPLCSYSRHSSLCDKFGNSFYQ